MRRNQYKLNMIKKDIIRYIVITIAIIFIVLISIIVGSNAENEQLYLEGAVKSMPLITNETLKRLGDLYIELNREFEMQIKEVETGYANRLNKRGDKIYYGVNGKENPDEMINDDYINGIQSIVWQKDSVDREEGESNFADMITVLTSVLESDVDRYDDDIDELFTRLFWVSHTFTGDSTELYPCKHGCAYVKYYCGDNLCQGRLNGEVVGHFNTDLKYDPFLVEHHYYRLLEEMVDEWGTPNIELFFLEDAIDTCVVHARGKEYWNSTTKSFRGCERSDVDCYHGEVLYCSDRRTILTRHGSRNVMMDCTNQDESDVCAHVCPPNCGGMNGCQHECGDEDGHLCGFHYYCMGHPHYHCKGHILCCCFGHTNLNLKIKIMYYEEMLDEFKKLIDET